MKQNKNNIVITSATRTAIGKFNGQFAKLKGHELGAKSSFKKIFKKKLIIT